MELKICRRNQRERNEDEKSWERIIPKMETTASGLQMV